MIVKDVFDSGRYLNTKICTLTTIVETVPIKIAYGIKALRFIDTSGTPFNININSIQLSVLQTKLGNAIINNDFDTLDDIIINFFKSYYCITQIGKLFIEFEKEKIDKFIEICNSFKGKQWDDIVITFFNELYIFIMSGKIGPYELID